MRGALPKQGGTDRARFRGGVWDRPVAAVAALTVLALALRAVAFGDGLYGDELITLDDTRSDLPGVFDGLDRNEINPPLFYLLAWGFAQFGDAVSLIRVPSIVFGTAVVPVVYALGRRLAGPRVGLTAALLVALSPFAIFYATEARAYASAMFFVALSALALLRALEPGTRPSRWALYGLATLCALYTHYTTIYVVAGMAAWAVYVHRGSARTIVLVLAAAAVAYLPWVPTLLEQRDNELFVAVVGLGSDLSAATVFEYPAKLVSGHPFLTLPELPGDASLVALAVGAACALLALLVPPLRRVGERADRADVALVAILALATPVGVLAYSLLADDLYVPRNLSVALPGLALAVAWLIASLRQPLAVIVALLIVVPNVVAGVRSLDHSRRRPDSPAIADYIERNARPGDKVATGLGDVGALPLYLRGHEVLTDEDPSVWRAAARGRTVFLSRGEVGALTILPRFAGPRGRYELGAGLELSGLRLLGVGAYSGPVTARLERAGGREVIALSTGRKISVMPGAVRGSRESVEADAGTITIGGWAMAADRSSPAEAVFVLDGTRCIGISAPLVLRADLEEVYGYRLSASGFAFKAAAAHAEALAVSPRLRVFGAVGNRASELPAAP
jgi:hypothetical protein